MATAETVRRSTGRTQEEWYQALDAWGAPGRPYREIADWLIDEHGVSKWWAQKLIVEYEQDRGLRAPGARKGGTFEVGASKTIGVPVDRVFMEFADARRRKKWLDGAMTLRSKDPSRSARFEWNDGSRVNVTFSERGPAKATVTVVHERLPRADQAQAVKARWRDSLARLKVLLEG